jgi:hypothetical protein
MSNEEKEELRHAVLECLVARHPAALPVKGVLRVARSEVAFTVGEQDVLGALVFLKDAGLARSQYDEMGSSTWWSASADGVKKVERG